MGDGGKHPPDLLHLRQRVTGGTSLFSKNPQQMFQSMAVPLWGREGKQRQASREPEDRKLQRPRPARSWVGV